MVLPRRYLRNGPCASVSTLTWLIVGYTREQGGGAEKSGGGVTVPAILVTEQVMARVLRRASALPPDQRRQLGDPLALSPELLQGVLIPSMAEEARAQYRVGQGRGLLVYDQSATLRLWYVPAQEVAAALARASEQMRADATLVLAAYEPTTEAILLLRTLQALQLAYVTAEGHLRSAGMERLESRPLPQQMHPSDLPAGVHARGGVHPAGRCVIFDHVTLGELGRVIVVATGPDEIRLDAEVCAGNPATRKRRGQLLLQVVERLDRGIHHGLVHRGE